MRLLFFLALPLCAALAQVPSGPPVFEVASIKPSAPGGRGMSLNIGGGRFRTENVPLRMLITFAYDIREHQLTGGPGWINTDRFDIVAKPDREVAAGLSGAPVMREMVKAMLAERFHLAVHRETKEMPVYALVVSKGGPKMTESPPEAKGPSFRGGIGTLQVTKSKMSMFAEVLSNQLGRTVIDKTGLTADYDFKLTFTPDTIPQPGKDLPPGVEPAPPPDGPSIFTALPEQIGLKLESRKGPVEMLVVDSAEKPSEN